MIFRCVTPLAMPIQRLRIPNSLVLVHSSLLFSSVLVIDEEEASHSNQCNPNLSLEERWLLLLHAGLGIGWSCFSIEPSSVALWATGTPANPKSSGC